MGRRALLLVAAVLLAAVGTGALYLYVTGRTSQVAGMTQVIVPAQVITAGTPIDPQGGQFIKVDVPTKLANDAGYLLDPSGLGGTLARQDLRALTPVTRDQFGDDVELPVQIPVTKGTMNIAIDLDEAARVGGFITTGSRVAVWLINAEAAQASTARAKVVLPEAVVVTTGTKATIKDPTQQDSPGDPAGSIVVLQVKQDQAAALLIAQQSGTLYLTQLGDTPATDDSYVQGPDGTIRREPRP